MAQDNEAEFAGVQERIRTVFLDPYRLLIAFISFGAAIGIGHLVSDYFAFPGDAIGQIKSILNDLFNIVAIGGFMLGLLAVIKAIRVYYRREERSEPDGLKASLKDPLWIIEYYPYLLAYVSLIHALFFVLEFREAPVQAQWGVAFFGQLWLTAVTVFIVLGIRAVVHWLLGNTAPAVVVAPSGAQENASEALTDIEAEADVAGEPEDNPVRNQWLARTLEDPDRLLTFGAYAIAYTGMLALVFTVWMTRDFSEGAIWSTSTGFLVRIVGAVGVVLIMRTMLRALSGQASTGGDPRKADGERLVVWIERLLNNPGRAPLFVLIAIWTVGLISYFALLWSGRNLPVSALWSTLFLADLRGVIVTASLLSIWATVFQLRASSGDLQQAFVRSEADWFFRDPTRILRIAVYAAAYLGLAYIATTVFVHRDESAWRVWYYFFNSTGVTIEIAGIIVALRVIVSVLTLGSSTVAVEAVEA